ncbi:hypothetical protein [Streptomyces sp. NPDC059080]|uniref:hypothetical protein n=1 Tax=Streptomyces sp. NPDC059080 TaxID=3346718 RepID=UPI0036CBD60E
MTPHVPIGVKNDGELPVSVEDILSRAPERAHLAYTSLVTNSESRYDGETGWSCAYITQQALADEMFVCLRTATRAIKDLRNVGLVRVLTWPGAHTETQVRIESVDISSPFGPVQEELLRRPKQHHIDKAIAQLVAHNRELEALVSGI